MWILSKPDLDNQLGGRRKRVKEIIMVQNQNENQQEVVRTTTTEQQQPAVVQPAREVQDPAAARQARYEQEPAIVRSTVTDTRRDPVWSATGVRIVTYIFGVVEVFLALRLLLKLLAANTGSLFIKFIYGVTDVLVMPFDSIFKSASVSDIATKSVLEPGTLVAMVVYALIAWGLVKLIMIFRRKARS